MAGYDFLGPIDTHWHTFGYDVGMMNEFYELKPGETVRNVLMYNSPTVLLTDLGKETNFTSGKTLDFSLSASHYGNCDLKNALLNVRLFTGNKLISSKAITVDTVKNGEVSLLHTFSLALPKTDAPSAMKLYATLEGGEVFAENEWELYLFPDTKEEKTENLIISSKMTESELLKHLEDGKDVLLFGSEPFYSLPTSFRISLSGRTSGNLATVIKDHPALGTMPHDGFCSWQFAKMFDGGTAVCFETEDVPFSPIIEVVSTHKYAIRQAALFEFNVENGRLLLCSFDFKEDDPASIWFRNQLISYAKSDKFIPEDTIKSHQLKSLINATVKKAAKNTNLAFNPNDKTAVRRNKN